MRSRLHFLLPLAVLLAALVLWWSAPAPLLQLQLLVFDSFLRFEQRPYAPAPVRIVDIDDESLARLGQWPWPRTLVAELVTKLHALGAAAVALDIVFAEPDRSSPAEAVKMLRGLSADDGLIARVEALRDNDGLLADAIAASRAVTSFVLTQKRGERLPLVKAGIATAGGDPRPWLPRFEGAVTALPALEEAAAGNGSVNDLPDLDGVTRRAPLLVALDGKPYPGLALEALRVAQGASTVIVKAVGANGESGFGAETGITSVKVGQRVVPTDAHGALWLHYRRHSPERFVPAWRVLDGSAAAALVRDNIVFIGSSAEGLGDIHPTPMDPVARGVEVQAELAEEMLSGDALHHPDWTQGAELLYMLVLGGGLILLLPRAGAGWSAVVGAAAIAAAFALSAYGYAAHGLLVDPVFPSLAALLVYLASSATLFLRTEIDRRRVRAAFSRYLAPAVVEQLASHPERLKLGGEMREMTLMFSDIRGFTTLSEGLDAEGLTRFINRFLTPMSELILGSGGTIDKYMGDAIMAFWNAPLDDPLHAENACRTALAMREGLQRLNRRWREEAEAAGQAFKEIAIGIGLNTGLCCVGNMGSEQRFDYSVLGDDVNLASRLEGQSKTYGVDIVLGERTAAAVPQLALLELDLIQVKGKTQPVRIHTLLGDAALAAAPGFAALKAGHEALLADYRAQRWDAAAERLAALRTEAPQSLRGLYALYEERIAAFRAAPPPADWDGVFVALTK